MGSKYRSHLITTSSSNTKSISVKSLVNVWVSLKVQPDSSVMPTVYSPSPLMGTLRSEEVVPSGRFHWTLKSPVNRTDSRLSIHTLEQLIMEVPSISRLTLDILSSTSSVSLVANIFPSKARKE